MSSLKSVDSANHDELLNSSNLIVLKFGADWCGPCKQLAPVLEKLDSEYTNVNFYDVNIDSAQELATKYGVRSVPTVFFIKNGEQLDSFVGTQPESTIKQKLDGLK